MKLSILIVSYNQEKYIAECLDSILIQKIPFEFEIIVADDNSTDSTLSIIIEKLINTKLNYRILATESNLGIVRNYQRAFQECKGNYIAVMEGDDYWTDPYRVKKHVEFLENHLEFVMSFNRMIVFNETKGSFVLSEWVLNDDYEYITAKQLASGNKIGNLSACVFRNSEIKKLNAKIFEIPIADWMLGMALGQYGLIAKLKDVMSVYRVNSNGEWSKMSVEEQNNAVVKLIDVYNKFLDNKYDDEFNEYKNSIINQANSKRVSTSLVDYIPPILLLILKLILPLELRRLRKRVFK